MAQGSKHGYNTLVECCTEVCEGLSKDPLNIAKSLLSKGFIALSLMEELQLTGTKQEKGLTLYTALLAGVKAYQSKYPDFISVLEEDKALYGDLLTALRNAHLKICNAAVTKKIENTNKVITMVTTIAKKLEMFTHSQELERISSALTSRKVQIGVVGLTNAGKSTTANSFIGSPFLPSSIQRQTVSSICIVHDPKSPSGELFGRRKSSDDLVSLASGIDSIHSHIEIFNTNDRNNDIRYSELILNANVEIFSEIEETFAPEILDMPGTCDEFSSQQAITVAKTALKSLAAIVLVVSAEDVCNGEVTKLVDGIKTLHPGLMEKQSRVLVLINKYDKCYDKNEASWKPDKIQKEMANHIGVPIEQTVCFSATNAQEAQKWRRNPSVVSEDMYDAKYLYFKLQITPEIDSIRSLKKYTEENVKKLAEVIEKFSRFQEVKTKLLWALCVNGPEIILDSAVDNCCAEVSKMEEAITHRIKENDMQGKESKVEQQKAEIEKVEQFFLSDTFFQEITAAQSSEIQLNDIYIQSSFEVAHIKKEYVDQKQALEHVLATRDSMLQEGREKVRETWKVGISRMKQNVLTNLKQLLQELKQKFSSEKIIDILNFNGVDPRILLGIISESFKPAKQPDFSKCTAVSDDAIKVAIRSCIKTEQRNERRVNHPILNAILLNALEHTVVVNHSVTVFEINTESLRTVPRQLASFCLDHVYNSMLTILKDVYQALWCELKRLSEAPIQLKKKDLKTAEKDLQESKKKVAELETVNEELEKAKKTLCESPSHTSKKREHEEDDVTSGGKPAPKKEKWF